MTTVAGGIIALWIASLLLMALGGLLVGAALLEARVDREQNAKEDDDERAP